jgi:hypothetical protein
VSGSLSFTPLSTHPHTLPFPPYSRPYPCPPTGSLVFLLVDLSLRACGTTTTISTASTSTLLLHDGLSPVSKHHSPLILGSVWTKTLVLFLQSTLTDSH